MGDLDEPQWSQTEYFALIDTEKIREVVVLYHGMSPSILLAISNGKGQWMQKLVAELITQLPKELYAHLSAGFSDIFETR